MNSDIKSYISFYRSLVPNFTKSELDFIIPNLEYKILKKNEIYLNQGKVQKKIAFVTQGLLRQYYIDSNGKEISVGFTSENNFSTDYNAFIQQIPSSYTIKSIEPTTLIELDYKIIQDGYTKYKNYERFGRLIAEKVLQQRQKKIESLLFDTAELRYLHFLKENPTLFNRISLSHLSTYLGIERQSLSRIRKNLSK